jgi:cytochrome d ubiquinol oxidase subunit I
MTTSQSHSPLNAATVGATLVAFIVVYFVLFGFGVYYILKLMGQGPVTSEIASPQVVPRSKTAIYGSYLQRNDGEGPHES